MSELGEIPAKRLNRFHDRVTMSDDIRGKTGFKAKLKRFVMITVIKFVHNILRANELGGT